jgi:Ser/Thr protein kinase RdoA (MazF antagonist)
MDLARPFIHAFGLSKVELVGEGVEFVVYKAWSAKHGQVALRVPKCQVYHNVNDPNIESKDLVRQELQVYELLQNVRLAVPVPKPFEYLECAEYPAMLCEYMEDDGSEASSAEMGRVAALIHMTSVPDGWIKPNPVAQEGIETVDALVQRIERRFQELVAKEPGAAAWAVRRPTLERAAYGLREHSPTILHMDFRSVNLRVREGRIIGVIDWSNALVGPAAIDYFRIMEIGGVDNTFATGYRQIRAPPLVSYEEEMFLRLDAALMLALVFISEAPDPERRPGAVRRVKELVEALHSTGSAELNV